MKATSYLESLTKILSRVEITTEKKAVFRIDEGSQQVVDQIISIKSSGKKVMIIGNGGSAAIASHVHNDLCKSVGMRALVFNETPLLTAFSNDLSYSEAFESHINLWADKGDMLIAISSSGKSENIIRATNAALKKGCTIVTLSGFNVDNPLRQIGHVNYYVPSYEYGYVELIHSIIAHYLSDAATQECIR